MLNYFLFTFSLFHILIKFNLKDTQTVAVAGLRADILLGCQLRHVAVVPCLLQES